MTERLVDVLKQGQALLHTFPVEVGETPAADEVALAKGTAAAAYAGLVPEHEHGALVTRIHVDRGGSISPPGDRLPPQAETREHLESCVRSEAYRLWEADGCPEGAADAYWHRAHEAHIRDRAYRLWEREGRPEGRGEEYWHRTLDFERE